MLSRNKHPSPFLETGPRRGLGIYREPPWEGLATEASEREGRTMASAATEAEKGSPVVVGLLVVGNIIILYLVLMLIVYIFECASCITSYTHRDYMVSNPSLITKQMLTFYSADTDQGQELTRLWDRVMIEQECCGTSGPMDWVNFTSAFRAATPEVVFPWPPLCCRRTGNFIPLSAEGCRLGHTDYLFTKVCPLPAAPLSVHRSGPPGSSVSSCLPLSSPPPLWASFFLSRLSGSLNSLATCPCSPRKSVGGPGSELAPATFLRSSGKESNRNHSGSTTTIVTTRIEPLRGARHSSKGFKSLSYLIPTTACEVQYD
ncbi:uroplakin-1a isoform X1 [Leptonychotes weddellii]|uniref:Uroplakin-1a n=1 Tax=Leptonychotes weddellii TaxID=9713 RepID=A0A7F8RM75_LEPWE|nr:uroplakin-1a isoform X1 [Leptonychotes weddellii]